MTWRVNAEVQRAADPFAFRTIPRVSTTSHGIGKALTSGRTGCNARCRGCCRNIQHDLLELAGDELQLGLQSDDLEAVLLNDALGPIHLCLGPQVENGLGAAHP